MPEFIAQCVPPGLDEFTAGYFEAAEFTMRDDMDTEGRGIMRDIRRGWTREARLVGEADCIGFRRRHAAELAEFCKTTGRTLRCAGHDLLYSREGHGTGFWDREAGDLGDKLHAAAEALGTCGPSLSRNGFLYFAE